MWRFIFIVKIQFTNIFPSPGSPPLLAVNLTAKLDWLEETFNDENCFQHHLTTFTCFLRWFHLRQCRILFLLLATCGRERLPVTVISWIHICGWRNNGQIAASQNATCRAAVIVESCATWLLQAESFAVLQTIFAASLHLQIWAFTVRKLILGCFPPPISCETVINFHLTSWFANNLEIMHQVFREALPNQIN